MNLQTRIPFWAKVPLVTIAGCIAPLSLAPFNYWIHGLISLMVLVALSFRHQAKATMLLGFAYGLGLYGVGASWVYISISQFGATSAWLALVLTAAFVAGLALCFSLPFYLYGLFANKHWRIVIFSFPALWVLGEWMRSWFLTGFPWLYLGYGHIDTPLAGWAPIFGVFGVSFMVATSAVALVVGGIALIKRSYGGKLALAASYLLLAWLGGALLKPINWTEFDDKPITLGMAQGNIPQERKWDPDFLGETYKIFHGLSEPLWQYDWVIWPEAAIPLMYHVAERDLASIDRQAKRTNTVFITGILYDQIDPRRYYNSIIAKGLGSGITYKTRLVPFGEYVPLEHWLRGAIEFFDLPTSIIHPGPKYERGLQANGVEIAPSICYEVVYPDLVAARAATSGVLLTVSNDAWFGLSIGPVQHFQMAQMRALENGRYMIRSTNNGISGIIDPKGHTLVSGGRYTREAITGTVYAATGKTPFIIWGSWPTVLLCFALMILAWWYNRKILPK